MTPKDVLRELLGLFVDDGSLAVNLLVWTAAGGVVLPLVSPGGHWQAPLLFAGYLAVLVENVLRAARGGRAGG